MRDFCETIGDAKLRERLLNAIRGRGAFRYFKDTIHQFEIADDWYAFRLAALEEIARSWLEENGIPYRESDD